MGAYPFVIGFGTRRGDVGGIRSPCIARLDTGRGQRRERTAPRPAAGRQKIDVVGTRPGTTRSAQPQVFLFKFSQRRCEISASSSAGGRRRQRHRCPSEPKSPAPALCRAACRRRPERSEPRRGKRQLRRIGRVSSGSSPARFFRGCYSRDRHIRRHRHHAIGSNKAIYMPAAFSFYFSRLRNTKMCKCMFSWQQTTFAGPVWPQEIVAGNLQRQNYDQTINNLRDLTRV